MLEETTPSPSRVQATDRGSASKLAPLLALYFAQGLPFGIQATALPLLLRERGASLQAIGFSSLLAVPWLGKALWAPLVDRYGSSRFGFRKSWIVPMQLGLATCALFAAYASELTTLAILILAMNFCAATQDIAVDALAISWLKPGQLGAGNAMQIVGYKLGMLTGGGLLVWASRSIGWRGVFLVVAGLMLAIMLLSLRISEPDDRPSPHATRRASLAEIGGRLRHAASQPGAIALLVVITTYKAGETLADAMWKPMLLDRGFAAADIGLWAGTLGMLFSLAGTSGTGLLARRIPLPILLAWVAAARALGVAGEWWISSHHAATAGGVVAVTCYEHLAGGAITTVVFSLMMRHTDRQIGATHYSLLASLEVLGKLPLATLSGIIAASWGYQLLYATGTGLSVAFALFAFAVSARLAPSSNAISTRG